MLKDHYDLELLEKRRRILGWSKPRLAQLAGMSSTTVYSILEGGNGREAGVQKLALALGVPMDQVVLTNRESEQKTA